jgi:hypothetical protein
LIHVHAVIIDAPALPSDELSKAEAIAACTSCLARRGLFSYAAAVRVGDRDAWVQQR